MYVCICLFIFTLSFYKPFPPCFSNLPLHKKLPKNLETENSNNDFSGFPGGAEVKNPPAKAGDTGSSPGPGRSHMPRSNKALAPQLLSMCSRAHEPQLLKPAHLEPVFLNKRSHGNEKPAHCNEEEPPLAATRESLRAATKTQRSQKQSKFKKIINLKKTKTMISQDSVGWLVPTWYCLGSLMWCTQQAA